MQRLQAFKYELMPNSETQRQLRRFAGSCRFVYNKALALQQANHEAGEKFIGYVAMAKHLDFPRFKRKGSGDSFRYPDPKQIKLDPDNSRIFLPKLGWIRYRNSRDVLGELRNVTVSSKGGKWFVSIQTQREVELPATPATTAIGIDLGIAHFATLSDGQYIEPRNSFKNKQAKLAKYQRRMAHKQKFSSNWKKAKANVQKIHTQIANARRDFLHKATTTLSQNHAFVFIEDLQVRNMSKSAAGTVENPGKKVSQKSGLNKAILDQG
ncbi:transposase [Thiothrix litoralis]|uniref:Transposase n=1 Tax=Thiothrix litoralis TaxID=2891210 RepID=A0ABX7WTT4_9GAMM|nr:RNA-guided endonuclease TnpB family protein [Thiothrix litoralis]QTR45638.1 transposase [Thiothrix litoralis]